LPFLCNESVPWLADDFLGAVEIVEEHVFFCDEVVGWLADGSVGEVEIA
jgi:hypothetical protein